jgi:hypothetical protein
MKNLERHVALDNINGCYVVTHENDVVSHIDYDEVLRRIERYSTELAGRGALPREHIESPVNAERGTMAAYDTFRNLMDILEKTVKAEGDYAVADLCPQLVGLEGHRVEVMDMGSLRKRRFTVGMSHGWLPVHMEIPGHGVEGQTAKAEYQTVKDLGPGR